MSQIFLHDRQTGVVSCASATPAGAAGDGPSAAAAVSGDGSVVAFESAAQNLDPPCAGQFLQVFVLQRGPGRLLCISVAPDGTPGNGPSFAPAVSGDGSTVVFSSQATNLTGSPLTAGGALGQSGGVASFNQWQDVPVEPINQLINGTTPTGERPNAINRDGTLALTPTPSPAGTGVSAVETVAEPPAGQPLIVQPASGTVFTLVGGIQLTVQWTAVAEATSYRLQFTGPLAVTLEVGSTTTFTVTLTPDIPPGSFQVRVVPLSPGGAGPASDPVAFTLAPGVSLIATDRPFLTAPGDGLAVRYNQPVTFAWTAVAGVTLYGVEFTGANLTFANPNGTAPDSVNGFGGVGGGFPVQGTSVTVPVPAGIPVGAYQVRIIGLGPTGAIAGSFSDAVTLTVQP